MQRVAQDDKGRQFERRDEEGYAIPELGVDSAAVGRRFEKSACSAFAKACTLSFQKHGHKPSQKETPLL